MTDTEILDYLQARHDEHRGIPYDNVFGHMFVTLKEGDDLRARFTERIEEFSRKHVAARLLT